MSTATWIREELAQRGVPYEERHHPEVFTAQQVAQCEHVSGHRMAKVVVAMVNGSPVELVLPASRHVLLDRVRELFNGRDVRLAGEDEMRRCFVDCEVGAIPPLRHWEGVEVLMDESLYGAGDILFQAGTHRDAIRMRFDDWVALVRPRVENFSAPTHPRKSLAEP